MNKEKQCNNECGTSFCCMFNQDWEHIDSYETCLESNYLRSNIILQNKELEDKFPNLKEYNIKLTHNPCGFLTDKGCENKHKPFDLCSCFPDKQVWIDAECPLVLPEKCKFASDADITT